MAKAYQICQRFEKYELRQVQIFEREIADRQKLFSTDLANIASGMKIRDLRGICFLDV